MWKIARFTILYYGLRAASADGELHPKELEAIHKLAKQLNVSEEEVQQIRSLINEENKLIEKRAKTIFPDGPLWSFASLWRNISAKQMINLWIFRWNNVLISTNLLFCMQFLIIV